MENLKAFNLSELFDLEPIEVSLVDRGANRKRFLLLKKFKESTNGGTDMTKENAAEILKSVMKSDLSEEKKAEFDDLLKKAALSESAQDAVRGATRLLNAVKDELPESLIASLAKLLGVKKEADTAPEVTPPPTTETKTDEQPKGEETMQVENKDGTADLSKVSDEAKPHLEKLFKANQDKEQVIKAQGERLEKAEKALKVEKDLRVIKEYTEKAAGYSHVHGNTGELGLILKACSETLPKEHFEKLLEILSSAQSKIEKGSLFSEAGVAGTYDGSGTYEKLQKAQEVYTKDNPKKSVIDFYKTPEGGRLYADYMNEKGVN